MEIQKVRPDLISMLFLILLTYAMFTFTQHTYLHQSSYSHAIKIKSSLDGAEQGLYYQALANGFSIYKVFFGDTSEAFISYLFIVPVILDILIIITVYLLLRHLFSLETSLISSLIFLFFQPFIGLGSNGLLSQTPFYFLASAIALLFFFLSIRLHIALALVTGILLGGVVNFSLGILLASAFFLSIILQTIYNYLTYKDFKTTLYPTIISLIAFIASVLVSGYTGISLNSDLLNAFVNYYLIVPVIVGSIIVWLLSQRKDFDIFSIVFIISSIVIAVYGQLYLAMLGLVIGVANLVSKIQEIKGKEYYLNWLLIATPFFVLLLRFLSIQQSLAVALLLGAISTFILKLYQDRIPAKYTTYSTIMFAFLALGLTSVSLIQISYLEPTQEFYNSVNWLKTNTPTNAIVATTEDSSIIEFLAERKSGNYTNLISEYLSKNSSTSIFSRENITYILLPNPLRQSGLISSTDMEIFAFNGYLGSLNVEQCSFRCAFFISQISGDTRNLVCGRDMSCLLIPVDSNNLPNGAPVALYSRIEQTTVPYGKLVIYKNNQSKEFVPSDLAVYPKNLNSNALKVYFPESFGALQGIKKVYTSPSGEIIIFKIESVR
ncbi:hypothetical protein HY570_04355 [Candidatus Micrarchaeota archaeon]|nr:hypothetical protein [Candidatus Micrarchaeota archaeon]